MSASTVSQLSKICPLESGCSSKVRSATALQRRSVVAAMAYFVTVVVTVLDTGLPSGPSGLALLTLAVLLIFAPTLAVAFTGISTSTGVTRVTDGVVQVTVPPALPQ